MKKLLPLLALLFAAALQAQKPAEVKVKQLNDRRTKGSFSQLMIYLELPKVMSADVAASRVLVKTAVDDAGNDLVDHEAQEADLEPNQRSMLAGNDEPRPVSVSLTLKNPARTAAKVKEVKGDIELFMPSKDPNSTAELTKFLPANGKAVSNKALKANGVEISMLTAAQLEAENSKREEYDKLTLDDGDVLVRIKDPNKRIQGMTYIDGAGAEQHVNVRTEGDMAILSTWGGKPGPDWKLRVNMKTAKNIVRYPFAIADVALP